MSISIFFISSSSIKNEETLEFLTLKILAKHSNLGPLNSGPSFVAFQTSKYSNDDHLKIVKIVLKTQLLSACGQNKRTSVNPPGQTFQPKISNVNKSKLLIDYYNFISSEKTILLGLSLETTIKFFLLSYFLKRDS